MPEGIKLLRSDWLVRQRELPEQVKSVFRSFLSQVSAQRTFIQFRAERCHHVDGLLAVSPVLPVPEPDNPVTEHVFLLNDAQPPGTDREFLYRLSHPV
jgi:hypothetical protein